MASTSTIVRHELVTSGGAAPTATPLGTIAKLASTQKNSGLSAKGYPRHHKQPQKRGRRGLTYAEYRAKRQEAAAKAAALRWELQEMAGTLLPAERCATCLRRLIPGTGKVTILHSAKTGNAHYGNLQRCSSVWLCPVCAANITEDRRVDMRKGLKTAREMGLCIVMFTYTFSHHAHQGASELVGLLRAAYRDMNSGRGAQDFRAAYGVEGFVESLEATWGRANGWHPHLHVLVFVPTGTDLEVMADEARERWEHAAARYGLKMNEHGFKADDCDANIADYVNKWGVEPAWDESAELTKWHVKTGEQRADGIIHEEEHYTPFGLLRLASQGNQEAGALFVEYARAFKGRQQLRWTPKLRKLLGIGKEKTDEQIIEEQEAEGEPLVTIEMPMWRVVLANRARGRVLAAARSGDPEVVRCALQQELATYLDRLFAAQASADGDSC